MSGASPLVDVRGSVSQSVMNREVLDTIPTGKDPFAVGQLIAGVTTSTPDVGGTQIMQQPTLQVHGSSNNDNVFMVDGVQIQHIGFGGNQTGFYFNDGLMDEISYQTSSLPAEAPVGGVQINMIPRDGGNEFHGSVFQHGRQRQPAERQSRRRSRRAGLQGAEPRPEHLRRQRARSAARSRKDRLWFFGTYRRWSAEQLSRQHVHVHRRAGHRRSAHHRRDDPADDAAGEEATSSSVHYDRSIKLRGHRPNNYITVSINDPLSDVVQTTQSNYIGEIKWTSPISSTAARRGGGFHTAGQLQPVVRARRGA